MKNFVKRALTKFSRQNCYSTISYKTYPKQLFINGEFVNSKKNKTFPVINPHNEQELCRVSEGDVDDINLAVQSAQDAFHGEWSKIGHDGRQKLLLKLADLWEKEAKSLTELECLNNGTPITQQLEVVEGLASEIRYHAGWCNKLDGRYANVHDPDQMWDVKIRREPIGVCGMIIPWNLPLWCLIVKLAPALACGNTVVVKVAEQTPLTALKVGEMLNECGFPKGVVNIISGYGPTAGAALSRHMQVRKIAFTGSTETARIVMQDAAKSNLKRIQCELGGKSPLLIMPDADIDQAVEIAAAAIFSNNGEQCDAGSRTFVHESMYDQFVEKAVKKAESLKVGNPLDPTTDIGPLVDKEQYEKVKRYIELGKREGAQMLTGGVDSRFEKGYYVKPTVFANVTDEMKIAREEIFGPVQSILKYSDPKEALKRANNTEYGLAAGIVTKNMADAVKFSKNINAGFVWVNTYFSMFKEVEFGGFKQSGFGKDGGAGSIEEWTVSKSIVFKVPSSSF